MGICPRCKKKVDELIYSAYELIICSFTEQGYEFKEEADVDTDTIEYLCPLCRKVVAKTEDEARKIISRGG